MVNERDNEMDSDQVIHVGAKFASVVRTFLETLNTREAASLPSES